MSDKKTPYPVAFLVPLFTFIMFAAPMVVAAVPFVMIPGRTGVIAGAALAPFLYGMSFVVVAGILSLPFQRAIVPGKFPRQVTHFVYGPRRMYGLMWCAVFYFTPLYYALMSVPFLRTFLLRTFGYRGHSDITIAPDAWLRDLPLLKFDQGIYVANKATVGTNICLADGHIMVGPVILQEKAMVGHLTMVAPGCNIGKNAELGVGCAVGIRVKVGDKARIGPTTSINHGAEIGDGVEVGSMSYIGMKAKIAAGVKLPSGSNIPEGANIETREQVEQYLSSETKALQVERARLQNLYATRLQSVGPPAVAGSAALKQVPTED